MPVAKAHKASDSYLEITPTTGAESAIDWRIALRDLDLLMNLDRNNDGSLSWAEVQDRKGDIDATLIAALSLSNARGEACAIVPQDFAFTAYGDGGYLVFRAIAHCREGAVAWARPNLFAAIDPSHRVLLSTADNVKALAANERVAIVLPDLAGKTAVDHSQRISAGDAFAGFVRDGALHIFGGIDHVLFLLALLLGSVLQRNNAGGKGETSLRRVLGKVAITASAFTLSHSITLGLAVFGVLRPPASLIEPAIAATVILAAVNNIQPLWSIGAAIMAFAFGFIHGFGFAEVLIPLQLSSAELARALLAFNLGVELGQLALILVFCVFAYPLRNWQGYRTYVIHTGSACTALIACVWLMERITGTQVFPFAIG